MGVVVTCELCGGPLGLLGQLGRRQHLLCRDCGMQFSCEVGTLPSREIEPEEADDEEDD